MYFKRKGDIFYMGYVVVKFLGDEYQVPEEINEFLSYDKLLNPMREKALKKFSEEVTRESKGTFMDNDIVEKIHNIIGEHVKLIEYGIDITQLSQLIFRNKA